MRAAILAAGTAALSLLPTSASAQAPDADRHEKLLAELRAIVREEVRAALHEAMAEHHAVAEVHEVHEAAKHGDHPATGVFRFEVRGDEDEDGPGKGGVWFSKGSHPMVVRRHGAGGLVSAFGKFEVDDEDGDHVFRWKSRDDDDEDHGDDEDEDEREIRVFGRPHQGGDVRRIVVQRRGRSADDDDEDENEVVEVLRNSNRSFVVRRGKGGDVKGGVFQLRADDDDAEDCDGCPCCEAGKADQDAKPQVIRIQRRAPAERRGRRLRWM
jgi:hypothetical protein